MIKNNKTESEIFEQIRESLERYEEAYIPGSWENFLQKRKNNNRKIFLRIASGIAACLLVGFLGINYFQSDVPSEKRVAIIEQPVMSEKSVATAEQSAKNDKSVAIAEQSAKSDQSVATTEQSAKSYQSVATTEQSAKNDKSVATAEQSIKSEQSVATAEQTTKIISEKPLTAAVAGSDIKQPADGAVKLSPGFTTESREQVAALPTDTKSQSSVNKTNTTKDSPDTTKSKTQNIFLNLPQTGDQLPLATADKRKVRFGVNFSPGVSTTESSSSLNYMGGLSADISLSSKVALSTGLQFENQSFVKNMPGIVSSANAPVNQTKTTVTNLDFPVNITWKFAAEKKHAYYVSAGLSSLVYLSQENKNTTYSQDLIPVSSLVNGEEIKSYSILSTMSVTQDAVTPDQAFDLAGRVNLMVGYEKKLSERIFIHFEPYAKFPTSSQAAGSLNHTTTGINFKISF